MSVNFSELREDYNLLELHRSELDADPVIQFKNWFKMAVEAGVIEPNGMVLSTVSREGRPSARVVLLKGVNGNSFEFYTNYSSRKGAEIENNNHVALTFWWDLLHRQVRIEGVAGKVGPERSTAYFQSRPKNSQIGAWVSPQSNVLQSRAELDNRLAELTKKYEQEDQLPRPDNWGGFEVIPDRIEFWQGRPNRLHDRFVYNRQKDDTWSIDRLAP